MEKQEFISFLKEIKSQLQILITRCSKSSGKQVQSKSLLIELESFATKWFEQVEPELRSFYNLSDSSINVQRELFGKILDLCDGRPSKQVVVKFLNTIRESFHKEIVTNVQKHHQSISKFPNLNDIMCHSKGVEMDYLKESIDCANLGKRRAAIILAWSAAIDRLHLYISKNGFNKFNQASSRMCAIQSGRYKKFNKKFDIQNLTDLRMSVFDNDLLWVLEFLGAIDGSQHEKLQVCFIWRNNCGHPGEANISDENILSFFSDLNALVFSNPRFLE